MLTKIFSIMMVLILSFTAVFGQKPVKVRIWDNRMHDKPYRSKMFKKFNREHKAVKIQHTSVTGGMLQQMLNLSFKTGNSPEMFTASGELTLEKLIDLGWITSLNDIAPDAASFEAWKARFPVEQNPFVEGMNMFNGKIYTFPWEPVIYNNVLFYNKKLFRKAGIVDENGEPTPPTTWSEFRQYAKRITKAGKGRHYGVALMAKEPDWAFNISLLASLAAASGYNNSAANPNNRKTGRFDYSSPILRKAIQLWIDLKNDGSILPGAIGMDDETARFSFALDRAGMIFGSYYVIAGFMAVNPQCDFDIVLPPLMKGAKRCHLRRGIGGRGSYVVSRRCKSSQAAWKAVDFISSIEFHEGWVKFGGGISIFPELNISENFPYPGLSKIARWTHEYIKLGPIMRSEARRVQDYLEPVHPNMGNIILGIFIGKVGFEALDDLEQRKNAAFDRAMEKARKDGFNVTRQDFIFPDFDPAINEDYVTKKQK